MVWNNNAMRSAALMIVMCAVTASVADAQPAGGFRFSLGFTSSSGTKDLADGVFAAVVSDFEADGFVVDEPAPDVTWPVGLTLHPYYEMNSGLGIGATAGPFIVGYVEVVGSSRSIFGSSTIGGSQRFFVNPVGPDVRYTLWRRSNVSPYVRAGLRFPLVFGDIVTNGRTGSFIGGGVELFRRKGMQLSAKVGYDTWAVDVESGSFAGTVEPGTRLLSVSVTW